MSEQRGSGKMPGRGGGPGMGGPGGMGGMGMPVQKAKKLQRHASSIGRLFAATTL